MSKLVLSEKYGIAAAIGLLLLTALNSATLMLVGSILGLVAGIWVIRQGDARRVAAVALAGFAVAAVFAIIGLVRTL